MEGRSGSKVGVEGRKELKGGMKEGKVEMEVSKNRRDIGLEGRKESKEGRKKVGMEGRYE